MRAVHQKVATAFCAAACLCLASVFPRAQGRTFDLLSASIADIQEAVGAGALSYERLVRLYLDRIMDELALGSRGLSSLGGQILNPYDLTRNPGGSSGGTAVAVNVGFSTVGLATETGFSIRSPASNNAIVGIAPSRGLVSRAGVIPISFTQDRVGVHAKTVADAALLLDAIRGFDADDLATAELLQQMPSPSFTQVRAQALRGARIGVLRDLFRKGESFEEANSIVERQVAVLREHGATIVGNLTTGADLLALMPTLRVNSDELQTAFDTYLRRRGPASPVNTFAALVATGKYLKGTTLESPVKSMPAPPIGTSDDGPRDNNISATTGLPAIVLPAGMTAGGLPIAIEILGRPFSESRLIDLAHACEHASRARVAPRTTPALSGNIFVF